MRNRVFLGIRGHRWRSYRGDPFGVPPWNALWRVFPGELGVASSGPTSRAAAAFANFGARDPGPWSATADLGPVASLA